MLKIASHLHEVAAKSSLDHKRVNLIFQKMFIHKMYENSREFYLPCLTLSVSPLHEENNIDYNTYIRPTRHQYDIFVWSRAGYAKRAWKSV